MIDLVVPGVITEVVIEVVMRVVSGTSRTASPSHREASSKWLAH
jgi:hypothetical protein